MPAALLETAFLDNQGDNAKLADPSVRQQIAVIIAKSVCAYFAITYKETAPIPIVVPPVTPVATSDPDIYLSVRVRQSKSDALVKQIISMGYACKVLPLA